MLCKFIVKGVVYQANNSDDFSPGGRDLISDDSLAQLQHDVHLFQELGINTLLICTFKCVFWITACADTFVRHNRPYQSPY